MLEILNDSNDSVSVIPSFHTSVTGPGHSGKSYNRVTTRRLIVYSFSFNRFVRKIVLCHTSINGIWPLAEVASPHDGGRRGKSSESVQYAMLKACDACADMGQL